MKYLISICMIIIAFPAFARDTMGDCLANRDSGYPAFDSQMQKQLQDGFSGLAKIGINVDLRSLYGSILVLPIEVSSQSFLDVHAPMSFKSADGTLYEVLYGDRANERFSDASGELTWYPLVTSDGYDSKGNPINGHCTLDPRREYVLIFNAHTLVRVGSFQLNKIKIN